MNEVEKHFDQFLGLEPEISAVAIYLQGRRGGGEWEFGNTRQTPLKKRTWNLTFTYGDVMTWHTQS